MSSRADYTPESGSEINAESVAIVGGGIIGIACAFYLSRAGYRVTVIDQGRIAGACSHGNCGYITPSHVLPLTQPAALPEALRSLFTPDAAFRVKPRLNPGFWRWMWQFARRCNHQQMLSAGVHLKAILDSSIHEYRQLVDALPLECEWQNSGLLYALQTPAGLHNFAAEAKLLTEHFGVRAQQLDSKQLVEFEPALKSGLSGGFHFPDDASVRPDRLTSAWYTYLEKMGVTFIEQCTLMTIEKAGRKITQLMTSRGPLQADHYIIAAGAWSAILARQLGCPVPVEPGKGYSLTMQRPEHCPQYPILLPEHHVGVSPFAKGYRLGSMMEFAGYDTSIPDKRMQQLKNSARHYLLEPFTQAIEETWYGWRPMTWDSLPIIGRVPELNNAFLATGHNMLGVSMAAATGRIIAELVQEKPVHLDISAFSPSRF